MPTKLPAYIHTKTGRAYLTFAADIYGRWNAGYTQWYDPEPGTLPPNHGVYSIHAPPMPVQDAETIDEAREMLESAMGIDHE